MGRKRSDANGSAAVMEEPAAAHGEGASGTHPTEPAPPADLAGLEARHGEARWVPLELLAPTSLNPREFRKDAKFAELVASFKQLGRQLQPGIARPDPRVRRGAEGSLELLAGRRRYEAAKAVGWPGLWVVVCELDDRAAIEVTLAENVERSELTPLEEARGIEMMGERGWDTASIASRFGKTEKWVVRRRSLSRLVSAARTLMERGAEKNPELAMIPLGVWEHIAAQTDPVQVELAEDLANADEWEIREEWCDVAAFRRGVAEQYTHDLRQAAWKLDDATLEPKAGACAECPKRSSCEPLLWDDDEGGKGKKAAGPGRCLDVACWNRKAQASAAVRIAELKAEGQTPIALSSSGDRMDGDAKALMKSLGVARVTQTYRVTECKPGAKGATPAVHVEGRQRGQVVWVTEDSRGGGAGGSSGGGSGRAAGGMTLKEKRAQLGKRRMAWVMAQIIGRLEMIELGLNTGKRFKADYSCSSKVDATVLAAVFGTDQNAARVGGVMINHVGARKEDAWSDLAKLTKDVAAVRDRLMQEVCKVWVARLRVSGNRCISQDHEADCKGICIVFGWEYQEFVKAAVAELPEPKAWAGEKAAAKKKEKSPAAAKGKGKRRAVRA